MSKNAGMKSKAKRLPARSGLRFIRDFLTGLAVYALIVCLTPAGADQSQAQPMPVIGAAGTSSPAAGLRIAAGGDALVVTGLRSAERNEAITILGLAFAALVAFDLALFRHLRRVYASPR